MSALDVLYVALTMSVIVLTVFLAVALYQFTLTLRLIQKVLRDIKDTTWGVRLLKNQLKGGLFGAAGVIIRTLMNYLEKDKGGDA